MGCDTLLVDASKFNGENSIEPPCHLAREHANIRILEVKGPVDEKTLDKLEEIASRHDAYRIIVIEEPEGDEECATAVITVIPLKPMDDYIPSNVVEEKTIEEGTVDGVKYSVVEQKLALCRSCPLYKPSIVRGIFGTPCSFRTNVYAHMMPSIKEAEVIPLSRIDELIREVESYTPRDEDEEKQKRAILEYLEAVKKYVDKEKYVFFNWC